LFQVKEESTRDFVSRRQRIRILVTNTRGAEDLLSSRDIYLE
jgi:hypothetical protein